MTELNWQDAVSEFERQMSETKVLIFAVGGGEIQFEIRPLSQIERDQIEAKAVRMRKRRRGDMIAAEELAALKSAYIQAGVRKGPAGYANTDEDIASLPANIRDSIADSVQEFAELDEETRIGFR